MMLDLVKWLQKASRRGSDAIQSVVCFFGDRKKIVMFTLLYKVLLDVAYTIIAPAWSYYGFVFRPNIVGILLSWVMLLLGCRAIDTVFCGKHKNAQTIFILLLYINYFPILTLVGFGSISVKTFVYASIYYILIYYFTFIFDWGFWKKKKRSNAEHKFIQLPLLAVLITVACCLTIVIVSGVYANFRFSLNLDAVYEWRSENKQSMSIIARYAFGAAIACNVVNLGYCLSKKKYIASALLMALQVLAFSVDGLKSTLFVMVFVLAALIYPKREIDRCIPAAVAGVVGLAVLVFYISGNMFIISSLVRRVMLLPGVITDHYVDFFSKNTPDFFIQGPLRFLGLESVYDREISYLIGAEYYVEGINFNSGLLSEAVSNLGIVGVFIMPVIVSGFLKIYERFTAGLSHGVVFSSSLYVAWFLLSSTLTTSLASHGILAQLVLLACLPKDK